MMILIMATVMIMTMVIKKKLRLGNHAVQAVGKSLTMITVMVTMTTGMLIILITKMDNEESQDFDYDLIRFLGRNQGVQRSYLNFSHQGNIHDFV